jgi:hypothetical protein
MKGNPPFQGEIIAKEYYNTLKIKKKIFLSRTSRPILLKLGTNYP